MIVRAQVADVHLLGHVGGGVVDHAPCSGSAGPVHQVAGHAGSASQSGRRRRLTKPGGDTSGGSHRSATSRAAASRPARAEGRLPQRAGPAPWPPCRCSRRAGRRGRAGPAGSGTLHVGAERLADRRLGPGRQQLQDRLSQAGLPLPASVEAGVYGHRAGLHGRQSPHGGRRHRLERLHRHRAGARRCGPTGHQVAAWCAGRRLGPDEVRWDPAAGIVDADGLAGRRRRGPPGRRGHRRQALERRAEAADPREPDVGHDPHGPHPGRARPPARRAAERVGHRLLRRPGRRARSPRRAAGATASSPTWWWPGRRRPRRRPTPASAPPSCAPASCSRPEGGALARQLPAVPVRPGRPAGPGRPVVVVDLARRRGRRHRPPARPRRVRAGQPDRPDPGDQRRVHQDPRRRAPPPHAAAHALVRAPPAARAASWPPRCSTRASGCCPPS